jgi:lipopolysaccharide/colanic/teichoic acid biosynthesis glycosyltransferase
LYERVENAPREFLEYKERRAANMSVGYGGRTSSFGGAWQATVSHGFNSKHDFTLVLERERARADRNGHGFSLVTFKVGEGNQATADRLKQVLADRLRLTDELGWYDDERLGVLLFNTPREGAWNYANRVQAALLQTAPLQTAPLQAALLPVDPLPECGVYTYPAAWPGSESEGKTEPPNAQPITLRVEPAVDPFRRNPLPLWKRAMDLALAPLLLVVLSPFLLLAALAIKMDSRGPVFFKQRRAGSRGKPFMCWKFRTMVNGAEDQKIELMKFNERSGVAFKMTGDPRVTRVGRLLRKTSLDELPQLFNVVRGEMCLVGPRPLPVDEALQQDPWHNTRLEVAPGITCLWQVYARHSNCFDTWARLDIEYVKKRSFLLDLKLLLMTIPAVISMRGAR